MTRRRLDASPLSRETDIPCHHHEETARGTQWICLVPAEWRVTITRADGVEDFRYYCDLHCPRQVQP